MKSRRISKLFSHFQQVFFFIVGFSTIVSHGRVLNHSSVYPLFTAGQEDNLIFQPEHTLQEHARYIAHILSILYNDIYTIFLGRKQMNNTVF